MSFSASFLGREGRLFERCETSTDSSLWLVLRLGSRDDHIAGCTHTLEHVLVKRIQAIIENAGTVNGYTTHDVLMITISMFDSGIFKKEALVTELLTAFFNLDAISEQEFSEAREQIGQELLLSEMTMKKAVTDASVQCLWDRSSLGKPIDGGDKRPGYKDFKVFLEYAGKAKFAVMASSPHLSTIAKHFSVGSDEIYLEMCIDRPSVYDPMHIKRERKDMGSMFVKAWGVGIPAISAQEIMTAGIVSGIWNQRLQVLKKYGSYVTACFPRIHRGEHSINVIYSGDLSAMDQVENVVKDIREKEISEEEMGFMKSYFSGVKNRAESDELKSMFLSDIFGQDTSVPFDSIKSNIHDWCRKIEEKQSGSVLWVS